MAPIVFTGTAVVKRINLAVPFVHGFRNKTISDRRYLREERAVHAVHDQGITTESGRPIMRLHLKNPFTAAAVLGAAILCGACVLSAFAPPRLGTDSAIVIENALHGRYDDWRSPMLAFVWSRLMMVANGETTILLAAVVMMVELALVTLSCVMLFRGHRVAALMLPLILLAPPVAGPMGLVEKDVWMGAFCALGVAFAFLPFRLPRALPLSFFALALACRLNAAAAVIPLLAFVLKPVNLPTWASWLRSVVIVAVLSIGIRFLSFMVFEPEPRYVSSVHMLYDLAAIELLSGERHIPEPVRQFEGFSDEGLKAQFDSSSGDALFYRPRSVFGNVCRSMTPDLLRQISRAWLSAALHHPWWYLGHRTHVFSALMGVPSLRGVPVLSSRNGSRGERLMRSLASDLPILFTPWLWHLLGILCLVLPGRVRAFSSRQDLIVTALLASAFFYTASFFFLAISPHYRYLWWSDAAICIAIVIRATSLRYRCSSQGRRKWKQKEARSTPITASTCRPQ